MSRKGSLSPPLGLDAGRPMRGGTKGDMLRGNGTTLPFIRSDNELVGDMTMSFAILNVAIITLEIIAIIVLIKCKKISHQIKYFSINYLLANTIYNFADTGYFLNKYMPYGMTAWSKALGRQLMTFTAGVSWCSMSLMAIERVMALQLSLRYQLTVTKRRVMTAIAGTWLANLAIFLSVLFGTVAGCNDWSLAACTRKDSDGHAYREDSGLVLEVRISMIVFVVYSIVLLVTIVKLHFIIKRHLHYISQFQPTTVTSTNKDKQKTSRFVLKLQVAHLLLHVPVVVYFIYFEILLNSGSKTYLGVWIRHASQLSLAIHAVLTLVLYFWNLKECRLVFFTMFCSCCGCWRKWIQKQRKPFYGRYCIDIKGMNSKNTQPSNLSGQITTNTSTNSQNTNPP